MKVLILLILFTLSQIILISCENIPRGRPTFTDLNSKVVSGDDDPVLLDIPERPSGAIIVQADHCGCKAGVPITLGDCAAFCSENQNSSDTLAKLYFNVELTEAITLDVYEDVYGWCKEEIIDPNTNISVATGVGCSIEVKDQKGNVVENLPFDPGAGQASFVVDISGLDDDETYRLSIMETSSEAKSTTFQVRKFSSLMTGPSGPLQLMPINRYSCMIREIAVVNGVTTIIGLDRFHLYFNSENRPEPLNESSVALAYCHDIETYGTTPINSPLLEETPGAFSLWFTNDPRFYDLDFDGKRDINQLIEQEVLLQGAQLNSTPDLFTSLNWMSELSDGNNTPGGNGGNNTTIEVLNKDLGFYMAPFIDDQTYKSYCPTQQHYYSSNPLFKAMRDLVAVDTEALYVAKEDNACNFLLINESVLSTIWFYIEGGQHIEPTTNTIAGKQVQFYWPADPASPFIKKSHQRIYTVKSTDDLGQGCSGTSSSNSSTNGSNTGIPTNIPPHDKRIGCVPVMGQ